MSDLFHGGNNFPTQYPHYGGQDVKYHFMFQFLVGNLEYLGLRLDLGYNLVSILSLAGFLMVLYGISYRMFKSFWAGVAAIVFIFFPQRNSVLALSVGTSSGGGPCTDSGRKYGVYRLYYQ